MAMCMIAICKYNIINNISGFNIEFYSRGGKCKIWRSKGGGTGGSDLHVYMSIGC